MSLFSFSSKSTEQNILVIELGSGSVSGSLVKVNKNTVPEIKYATRQQITFQKNLETERVLPLMLSTLDKVCDNIQKEAFTNNIAPNENRTISEICFILSSPWCISQTKIVSLALEKPVIMTKSYLNKILEEQENNAEQAAKTFFENLHDKDDALVFEKKTIQIKLNGYKVDEVIGKIANKIELAFLISITPNLIINDIKNTVGKYFSVDNTIIHSYTLSSLSAIRDIFPDKKSYIILDLSSEITDLSLVRDDIMSGGISFPIGRNHFVRQVASDLKISIEEAFSLLATYHSKNLNKIYDAQIENVLSSTMSEWSQKLKESLETLAKEAYIPRTIFKATNDDFGVFFADRLNLETFSQLGFSQEKFNVIMLDKNTMDKYCSLSPGVRGDVFMMTNAIYVNKLFNL